MSLLSIIANAGQSLSNTQTQLGIVSDNIGNAQNPNYVEQDAIIVDTANGEIVDVSRNVNQSLQQEVLGQTTTTSGQSYLSQLYQQLEQLDGSSTGTPALSSATQSLVSAFQSFDAAPESGSAQNGVIQAAEQLVSTVHTIADGIETTANNVQTQTEADVKTLNGDLSAVAALNQQIVTAKATGQPTSNLETERDTAISDISSYMPVKTTANADGSITLATPGGVSLVSGPAASQFAYSPFVLGANGKQGTNASISLVGSPSVSLNGAFSSGKIGTELNVLRVDDAGAASTDPSVAPLEKMRRQLDAFVDQFYSSNASTPTAFQKAYNSGTAGAATDLLSNFFVIPNQSGGGDPQTAGDDRMNFELNPALVDGSATLKQSSANAVTAALTANSSATAISAGDIQGFSGSISALADAIANSQTQRASSAEGTATQSSATLSAVQTAYANQTGVSMDQQLSQMLVLQNSYSASAKLISTSNNLLQTLISDYASST